MAVWTVLRTLGIFCCHLVCLKVIWYIFSRFGMLYQEKSGNPEWTPPAPAFDECKIQMECNYFLTFGSMTCFVLTNKNAQKMHTYYR
jgi:hypothetical protein